MLKIQNINKSYKNNLVLKNINLDFKTTGMYFILGPSGSGKSTLLNLIGGLDKPTNGHIQIDNEDLTNYKNKELDKYHLNTISFIFQDYNLISYMTVQDNIKLSHNKLDDTKIKEVLIKLNIYEKKNELVKNLSGGEQQRVAIARAILKNSDIILCDEPTGALDRDNGKRVMDILKELSKNRLVIIVSHDINLANTYADKIINILDGETIYQKEIDNQVFNNRNNKKIKKNYLFKLALKNLLLNKKRTILTSLASSIGITCLLLVSFLSIGFNKEINELEKDIVKLFPITINNKVYEEVPNESINKDEISIKEEDKYLYQNIITKDYINYINKIKEIKSITYNYDILLPLITDSYNYLNSSYLKAIPNKDYIKENYDLLSGRIPSNSHELLLVVDQNNQISSNITNSFNIKNNINILNRKIKIILNDNYYQKNNNYLIEDSDLKNMYEKDNIELTIVGIIKEKEETYNTNFLLIDKDLYQEIININKESSVVKSILEDKVIIPNNNLSKEELLSFLGYNTLPNQINIYVDNLKNKDLVLDSLDEYNKKENKIIYDDSMQETISIVKDFTNIVTIILLLFSLISLVVSSLMISILTNTRILERVKEIGILRSLGLSKKNINSIFNKENIIISLLSSIISIIFIIIIKNPLNNILYNYLESNTIFRIDLKSLIIIVLFNIFITLISGIIPASKAGKKQIVECLR